MDGRIVDQLAMIVGDDYVSTRRDVLLTYSQSASMAQDPVMPGAVVKPKNTQEVRQVLQVANQHGIPVTPRSGGSSLQGEVIPKADGLVVELLRLDEIKLHKELRSVTVGAGVTFGALEKYLSKQDLWLPVYPESALACTVAGNVAVNGAGPGSSLFGCIGELVLGVEVVLPDGRIIQTGTEANPFAPGPYQRYAFGSDITGLLIGSLGGFGIITKVSMKVMRRMRYFDYCTYGFETPEQAERFLIEVRENDINGLFVSIYDGDVISLFMDMLGDELGIPKTEWPRRTVPMTIGRVREGLLKADAAVARALCEELGGQVLGVPELPKMEWDGRLWNFVRACYCHGWHWRTLYHHQTPTNSHKSVDEINRVMEEYGFLGHTAGFHTGHASFNCYPHLYFDPQDPLEEKKIRQVHDELAKILYRTGAVPFKLAEYWSDAMEGVDDYMNFLRLLKKCFDPKGIMNKGMIGGI